MKPSRDHIRKLRHVFNIGVRTRTYIYEHITVLGRLVSRWYLWPFNRCSRCILRLVLFRKVNLKVVCFGLWFNSL